MSHVTRARGWLCASGLGAVVLAAALAAPATAGAQAFAHQKSGHVRRVHFSLSGLVQSEHKGMVEVYVEAGRIGNRHLQKVLENVTVGTRGLKSTKHKAKSGHGQKKAGHRKQPAESRDRRSQLLMAEADRRLARQTRRAPVAGDIVHLAGMAVERHGLQALDATTEDVVNTHAAAVVGTVSSVTVTSTSSSLVMTPQTFVSGSEGESEHGHFTIDASQAAVSVDGTVAQLSSLVSGETVVVIGEKYDGSMMAAAVLAFSAAPSIAWGHLVSVSGTTLDLANQSGQSAIDASTAALYLNGASGASFSQLSPGSFVVALGPSGTTPLAATTVLDFNRSDNHPAGDNPQQGNGDNLSTAVFGTIQQISGTTVSISSQPADGAGGGGGDHALPADGGGTVNVNAGSASVSLDNSSSSLSSLVAGDTVMVLGSSTEDQLTASSLYAYDNAPSLVSGALSSLTATGFTVVGHEGSQTSVDASSSLVYLDAAPSSLGALANNDFVVVFGAGAPSTFAAEAVFAFNGGQDS